MKHVSRTPTEVNDVPPAKPESRTTYERATGGYDDEFRKRLADAILVTIAETSLVTDANVMAIRTAESRDALVTCLITIMAMTPYYDVPSHLREFAEHLAKKVRRDVARLRAEPCSEAERMFGFRDGGEHDCYIIARCGDRARPKGHASLSMLGARQGTGDQQ
jgi:hypothetical protein